MVLGDLGHADVAEHLARRPIDGLQERELSSPELSGQGIL
jgi:hypothetical protein